jgi:hypothetical protein
MLIVALVMAVIGLAALVAAVVTSNEVIAWVCIGASVIGVVLLIVDALRERQHRDSAAATEPETAPHAAASEEQTEDFDADYPDEPVAEESHAQRGADEAGAEDSGESGRRPG